jgi:hypothetical protein
MGPFELGQEAVVSVLSNVPLANRRRCEAPGHKPSNDVHVPPEYLPEKFAEGDTNK